MGDAKILVPAPAWPVRLGLRDWSRGFTDVGRSAGIRGIHDRIQRTKRAPGVPGPPPQLED